MFSCSGTTAPLSSCERFTQTTSPPSSFAQDITDVMTSGGSSDGGSGDVELTAGVTGGEIFGEGAVVGSTFLELVTSDF